VNGWKFTGAIRYTGLWVKCGIAEIGMRKVKCGIKNAEWRWLAETTNHVTACFPHITYHTSLSTGTAVKCRPEVRKRLAMEADFIFLPRIHLSYVTNVFMPHSVRFRSAIWSEYCNIKLIASDPGSRERGLKPRFRQPGTASCRQNIST